MRKKKILIVDDQAIMREGTAIMLQMFGFAADTAASANDALTRLKAGDYAGILMDCNMPAVDGFECTRQIRELETCTETRIPIIGFSANSDPELEEQCLQAGMDTLLAKDCTTDAFRETVLRFVGMPE